MNDQFLNFIKSAAQTYSYTVARRRNFNPPPPSIKPRVVKLDAAQEMRAATPKRVKTDTPAFGQNKPSSPSVYPTWRYTHPFAHTISGTGNGHQYWYNSQNPYET